MSGRLLLVEDEAALAQGLAEVLSLKGYRVEHVESGRVGLERALAESFDLLLLDGNLPELSGFELLRQLRGAGRTTPVIMLTARGQETDRVLGFELGVDDYVTKPFSLLELLGRVSAVLRRTQVASSALLRFGSVSVDLARFTVSNGATLPSKGYTLLSVLAARGGQVLDRETLMDQVWGEGEASLRTLNNLVVKIRQAIEEQPDDPRYLQTVHGAGYRLNVG